MFISEVRCTCIYNVVFILQYVLQQEDPQFFFSIHAFQVYFAQKIIPCTERII